MSRDENTALIWEIFEDDARGLTELSAHDYAEGLMLLRQAGYSMDEIRARLQRIAEECGGKADHALLPRDVCEQIRDADLLRRVMDSRTGGPRLSETQDEAAEILLRKVYPPDVVDQLFPRSRN